MRTIYISILVGEGGKDAMDLIKVQRKIYERYLGRLKVAYRCEQESNNKVTIAVDAPSKIIKDLMRESGGHRWQRVPPNEKRGRVHTSTVRVVVYERMESVVEFNDRDFNIRFTKDSGPGGQHRNKTESCVVMTHIETGIKIKIAGKDQHQNRRHARKELEIKVKQRQCEDERHRLDVEKKGRMGSGMRADKIRTYRELDNLVISKCGNKVKLKKVLGGYLDLLFE